MQGIRNLNAKEADELKSKDADYAIKDLFNSIESKNCPKWKFCIQVMPEKDYMNYKWNVFDVTKVWPHKDYPLIEIGVLELNKNPQNYFEEVEQSAFCPSHMVPGIEPSFDKML